MTRRCYVIFDKTAETASDPFTAKNDAVALRSFQQAVKQADYPEEFALYFVADLVEETGMMQAYEPKEVVPRVSQADQETEV